MYHLVKQNATLVESKCYDNSVFKHHILTFFPRLGARIFWLLLHWYIHHWNVSEDNRHGPNPAQRLLLPRPVEHFGCGRRCLCLTSLWCIRVSQNRNLFHQSKICPTKSKYSMCILDHMQSTFFCSGKFVKSKEISKQSMLFHY